MSNNLLKNEIDRSLKEFVGTNHSKWVNSLESEPSYNSQFCHVLNTSLSATSITARTSYDPYLIYFFVSLLACGKLEKYIKSKLYDKKGRLKPYHPEIDLLFENTPSVLKKPIEVAMECKFNEQQDCAIIQDFYKLLAFDLILDFSISELYLVVYPKRKDPRVSNRLNNCNVSTQEKVKEFLECLSPLDIGIMTIDKREDSIKKLYLHWGCEAEIILIYDKGSDSHKIYIHIGKKFSIQGEVVEKDLYYEVSFNKREFSNLSPKSMSSEIENTWNNLLEKKNKIIGIYKGLGRNMPSKKINKPELILR